MSEAVVRLTREPIDAAAVARELRRDDAGALIVFEGVVRAERSVEGGVLAALDYSAYEEMALEQMQSLRERALRTFAILDAALVHRLGRMGLGETSVVVAVAAGHRAAAFEACRWLIDTLKQDVPIWKRDVWADGTMAWTDPIREAEKESHGSTQMNTDEDKG